MNKKTLIGITVSTALTAILAYIVINALLLGWPRYKVPGYPVGGSDNETTYKIDPLSILISLERGETGLFIPAPSESEVYEPPTWPPGSLDWNQDDHMNVASALHQFVWKKSLEDWELYDATFSVSRHLDGSFGIDYSYMVFYLRQNDRYIVHDLTIDLLYGDVKVGESVYEDKGWRGFNLDDITINNVDQVLSIAYENGGKEACLSVKANCHINVYLGPALDVYQILFLPFYGYEWNWRISYFDNSGNTLFRMSIDPYTGEYRIRNSD